MNKKFFTLAAGLLLTSAFSANAAGEEASLAKSKVGQYVEIKVGASALQIKSNNELETEDVVTVDNAKALTKAFNQQWQIASLKYDANSGTPIYQFINKGTGQYLAVNLKTDNKGTSKNVAKINAAGNKNWCYDSDSKHLYVFQNDSTYTLDSDLKLIAAKGNTVPADAANIEIARNDNPIDLSAAILNELMGKGRKLYFNGANVTSGETNIVADNVWKAYEGGKIRVTRDASQVDVPAFFMARFNADSVTSVNKNPYVLVIDTAVYAGSAHHKLMIDTLAITKSEAAVMKDPTTPWNNPDNYNSEKKTKFAHQIDAATWRATYTLGNDSIALAVKSLPTKEKQLSVITNGDYVLGSASDMSAVSNFAWPAGNCGYSAG